jgi:hypothetical protein
MVKGLRWVVLVVVLMTAGCQAEEEPVVEETLESLRPFLVTLEDLGWTSGYSADIKGLADDGLAQNAEQYLGIVLKPFSEHPRYGPPDQPQGAGHSIFIYQDRESAIQAFEMRKAIGPAYNTWGYYEGSFDPRLENMKVGCTILVHGSLGEMQNCQVMMQYDRYIASAAMLADGQAVTMQDWANLLGVMQTKLLGEAAGFD